MFRLRLWTSALAFLATGCANMTTISLTRHVGSRQNPVTIVVGDAKQTATTIAPDRSSDDGQLVICPGKPPLVYSVHSGAGSASLGKSASGIDLSLAGSASEVGAVIAPLAALTLNADNMDAACHDRLNGWINSADYDTVQMRTRNATLAAFAFQAISALGSGASSSTVGGGAVDATVVQKATQDAADSAKKEADDAKSKYETSAKSDGSGGFTCDGAADATACAANKKDAAAKAAKSDVAARATANGVKLDAKGAAAAPGGSAQTAKPATDAQATAIVKIYEEATSREAEVTALCIKLFTNPDAFSNLLQATTDQLRQGCASALAIQAVATATKASGAPAVHATESRITSDFVAALAPGSQTGRVYMQIPIERDRPFARQLQRLLTADGLPVVNGIEDTGPKTPTQWEIRYFFDADLKLARALAAAVALHASVTIQPRKLPVINGVQPGNIELWIGKSFTPPD